MRCRVGVGGEGLGERVDVLRLDREAGGRTVAAEALEVLGAGREAAVEVERRRSTGRDPFQSPSVPAIRTTGRL